jgi:hypothetical protein
VARHAGWLTAECRLGKTQVSPEAAEIRKSSCPPGRAIAVVGVTNHGSVRKTH